MSGNEDAMSTSTHHEDIVDEEMAEASDTESEFGAIDKLDIVSFSLKKHRYQRFTNSVIF